MDCYSNHTTSTKIVLIYNIVHFTTLLPSKKLRQELYMVSDKPFSLLVEINKW